MVSFLLLQPYLVFDPGFIQKLLFESQIVDTENLTQETKSKSKSFVLNRICISSTGYTNTGLGTRMNMKDGESDDLPVALLMLKMCPLPVFIEPNLVSFSWFTISRRWKIDLAKPWERDRKVGISVFLLNRELFLHYSKVHNSKIERCLSKQNLYILNVQAFVNKERHLYPERQSVNQSGNLQTK